MCIRDSAEADHTRMGQSHLVYTVEVGLFGAVELFLCTGSGCLLYTSRCVEETVPVLLSDARNLGRGGRHVGDGEVYRLDGL